MNSVLQKFDGVSHLACELCIVHRIEVQVDIVQLDTWYLNVQVQSLNRYK
jgi:hypothetical protein